MKIRFTADSTCDMSREFIERYQVEIIPLRIELDGQYYTDGVDLTPDEIIAKVNGGAALPKTSAVNSEEYREVFTRMRKDCDAVIHFNISSEFSSCYQNARIAAQEMDNVWCVDSRSLSSGIALMIAEAADRAEAGMAPAQIVEELEGITEKLDVSFIVDRLDYLYKGGRCSMLAMLGANMLHIRPSIEVSDGKMVVGRKYRGTYERCVRQYLADRLRSKAELRTRRVFLTHTGLTEKAITDIRAIIADEIEFEEIHVVRAGCSITSHCGENTFGLLMMRK